MTVGTKQEVDRLLEEMKTLLVEILSRKGDGAETKLKDSTERQANDVVA